jgi:hypothetical protein
MIAAGTVAAFALVAGVAFLLAEMGQTPPIDPEDNTGHVGGRFPKAKQGAPQQKAKKGVPQPSRPKIWPRVQVAKLVLTIPKGADLDSPLDEAKFPKVTFDEKQFGRHLAKAVEAVGKGDFRQAGFRVEARTSSSSAVSYTLYLFRDSEASWPADGAPLKMRTHGVRLPLQPGDQLGKVQLGILLAQLAKETKEDSFDLLLTAAKMKEDGTFEGTFLGKLPGGGQVTGQRFTLTPWRLDDRRFDPAAKD